MRSTHHIEDVEDIEDVEVFQKSCRNFESVLFNHLSERFILQLDQQLVIQGHLDMISNIGALSLFIYKKAYQVAMQVKVMFTFFLSCLEIT